MIIGFTTSMTTINETLGRFIIDVHSKIISEVEYEIGCRHIQGRNPTDATVETSHILDPIFDSNFDARFGYRRDRYNPLNPLETFHILQKGHLKPRPLLWATIFDDVHLEPDECFTVNILIIDEDRGNFICNKNEDNPEDLFCDHTLCILNDDG